jgi:arylsulfatase A-like enzyme
MNTGRCAVVSIVLALTWLLAVNRGHAAEPVARPNILFILADDLGWKDLGCTGSGFYQTPAIDRLATQGMRFTQAYAACNVCSPTRASIMTGKYPGRLHTTNFFGGNRMGALLPPVYSQLLPTTEVTIAKALKQQGYRTAMAGKWHLGGQGSQPTDHGFDRVLGPTAGPGRGTPDDPHHATALSTAAAEFMAQGGDQPFFMYLAFHSVHVPLKTRADLEKKYAEKAAALPASAAPREVPVGDHLARAVQDHAVYGGMVQEMDEAVDRVLRKLDELKIADRTIVVFTSDNGGLATAEGSPTCNLPLKAGKGWNYEGGIRVPLMVRLPGRIAAGSTCDAPVISVDFYPTLLELAGLRMPKEQQVDGVSFKPLLEQKGPMPQRPLFWHYPHYSNQGGRPGDAVRLGNLKAVEFFEDWHIELYDLAADPGETKDLASAQPQRVAEMKKMLADWRKSVDAQLPTANPKPVDPWGPDAIPNRQGAKKKK